MAEDREADRETQQFARGLLVSLAMLVRTARLHRPDNAIFDLPVRKFCAGLNHALEHFGRVELLIVNRVAYLNDVEVRTDLSSLAQLERLNEEMAEVDVGGLDVCRRVEADDLRSYLGVFWDPGSEDAEVPQGNAVMPLSVTEATARVEELEAARHDLFENQARDRRTSALLSYSRIAYFFRHLQEHLMRGGPEVQPGRAVRLVQDLVEICSDATPMHFLGVSAAPDSEEEYLAFHSTNVCCLSILVGRELGLDRRQLRALGTAALFHDIGKVDIPISLLSTPGILTPDQRTEVHNFSAHSVRRILCARHPNWESLLWATVAYEYKFPHHRPDEQWPDDPSLMPDHTQHIYSRIVAVCDVFDALVSRRPYRVALDPITAMAAMEKDLRHKFDPVILGVLARMVQRTVESEGPTMAIPTMVEDRPHPSSPPLGAAEPGVPAPQMPGAVPGVPGRPVASAGSGVDSPPLVGAVLGGEIPDVIED